MRTIWILKNVSEIKKIYSPTEIQNRTYCLKNFSRHRTAETICLNIKIVAKTLLKKKTKNDPTEWITFLTYLKICGEKFYEQMNMDICLLKILTKYGKH